MQTETTNSLHTATLHDDFSTWNEEITSQTVASPTYRYSYDGDNVHEDDYARVWTINESPYDYHDVNRYGLGARGIDWFERQSKRGASTTYATTFPLYDGHGNNLTSISRSGLTSGGVSLRLYDAWGAPRSGTHDLDTRYGASIGHRTDDESGLIYMRARYYEPGSVRFISEDPAMDGNNWYAYCGNQPITKSDRSGRSPLSELYAMIGDILIVGGIGIMIGGATVSIMGVKDVQAFVRKLRADYAGVKGLLSGLGASNLSNFLDMAIFVIQALNSSGGAKACNAITGVVAGIIGYNLMLWGYMLGVLAAEEDPYASNRGLGF